MHVKIQSETINITPKIQILFLDVETLQSFLPLLSLMWYKENYISLYSINSEVLCKYFIIRSAAVSNMLNFVKNVAEIIRIYIKIPEHSSCISFTSQNISNPHQMPCDCCGGIAAWTSQTLAIEVHIKCIPGWGSFGRCWRHSKCYATWIVSRQTHTQ